MAFLVSIQMVDNSAEKIKDYKKKKKISRLFHLFTSTQVAHKRIIDKDMK